MVKYVLEQTDSSNSSLDRVAGPAQVEVDGFHEAWPPLGGAAGPGGALCASSAVKVDFVG